MTLAECKQALIVINSLLRTPQTSENRTKLETMKAELEEQIKILRFKGRPRRLQPR